MADQHDSTQAHSTGCGCTPAQRPLDLLLLGAPGSGKGTLAALLIEDLGVPHIATGDLFRENLKHNTPLGQLAKTYMDKGQLVPDEVTANMMAERLARPDAATGFVLDGFPRTLPQAEALKNILTQLQRGVLGVLYLKVSDQLIVSRLSSRLICRQCQTPYNLKTMKPQTEGVCDKCGGELYQRDDDKPETVSARLQVYYHQTAPLIEYYTQAGLVHELDGEVDLSIVTRNALDQIRKLAASK